MIDTFILVTARVLGAVVLIGFCAQAVSWMIDRVIRLMRLTRVVAEYIVCRKAFVEWKKRYGDKS